MDDSNCILDEVEYHGQEYNRIVKRWKNPQGKLFRINGPAMSFETLHNNGSRTLAEYWYQIPGKIHRTNSPAIIESRGENIVLYEIWYKNDKKFREINLPSTVSYHEFNKSIHSLHGLDEILDISHKKIKQLKYTNEEGEIHRTNGPAVIEYNEQGEVIFEKYYLNNIRLDFEEYQKINSNVQSVG